MKNGNSENSHGVEYFLIMEPFGEGEDFGIRETLVSYARGNNAKANIEDISSRIAHVLDVLQRSRGG